MDLTDRSSALARTKERVLQASLRRPTETALALRVFMRHVLHSGGHLNELLEVFLIRVCEERVSAVALFLSRLLIINFHLICLANLLHRKLYSSNFQDVLFLNFVVLKYNLPYLLDY